MNQYLQANVKYAMQNAQTLDNDFLSRGTPPESHYNADAKTNERDQRSSQYLGSLPPLPPTQLATVSPVV